METTLQLSIAQSISKKYAFEHGLQAMDVLGAACEAVEKAQLNWNGSKGKGLKGWAYLKLMGIMARENYAPKQYGAKARFTRLDSECGSEDGDGMAISETISEDADANATEDRYIQAIRVKEAIKIYNNMSPRLRALVDAEIEGVEFVDGKAELGNKVYTAARASQLGKDLPARISGQAEAESGQMGLFEIRGEK